MSLENFSLFPIWYVVFLFSLTCHEAAHAFAAKLGGDLTDRKSTRLNSSH